MKQLNLQDLFSDTPKVKYACAKQAIAVSEEDPESLYPDFDFFLQFLDGKNQILQWTAIKVIGNLSKGDRRNKVDPLVPKLVGFLKAGKLISAANAVYALTRIACYKPIHKILILHELIKVEKCTYNTPECRNVVIGHVLKQLTEFPEELKQDRKLLLFIIRQTKNPRRPVRKLAETLLQSINKYRTYAFANY